MVRAASAFEDQACSHENIPPKQGLLSRNKIYFYQWRLILTITLSHFRLGTPTALS